MGKEYRVSIATLTDYHLQDFIRCPYQFYVYHIEKISTQENWRKMVQLVVNQVVSRYYKLPPVSQTTKKVMELIDEHWRVMDVRHFESKIHYYTALAKITDHLIQSLTSGKNEYPPLFLYEKFHMNIDELGTDLSLTLDVAEWSTNSFIIKKYLIDINEEMNVLFIHMISVFCQKAFGRLPERIEIISLMDGEMNKYIPTMNDVSDGLEYLNIIKNRIQDPKNYLKTDCLTVCNSCS
ncbi:PD-(D/E)XK nuclease family protein [Peribacillus muralis]